MFTLNRKDIGEGTSPKVHYTLIDLFHESLNYQMSEHLFSQIIQSDIINIVDCIQYKIDFPSAL